MLDEIVLTKMCPKPTMTLAYIHIRYIYAHTRLSLGNRQKKTNSRHFKIVLGKKNAEVYQS